MEGHETERGPHCGDQGPSLRKMVELKRKVKMQREDVEADQGRVNTMARR